MNRVLFSIGPFSIYWYSFLILVAVFVGYEIVVWYSKKINFYVSDMMDMFLYLIICSIIGARLYYVIFNFNTFKGDLLGIFQIWRGGLAIYGGIIGGLLYIVYYCFKKKINFIRVLDIYSLSLLLGQAIGRWGNFFNQEAYGGVTTLESLRGLYIPDFIINGMYIDEAYRQPTFLYESLWCLIGVFILFFIRKKKGNVIGKQVCFYFCWYGFGRFFIEGLRSDSLYIGSYRVSQIFSVIIFLIGMCGNIYIWKKSHVKIGNVGGVDGRI